MSVYLAAVSRNIRRPWSDKTGKNTSLCRRSLRIIQKAYIIPSLPYNVGTPSAGERGTFAKFAFTRNSGNVPHSRKRSWNYVKRETSYTDFWTNVQLRKRWGLLFLAAGGDWRRKGKKEGREVDKRNVKSGHGPGRKIAEKRSNACKSIDTEGWYLRC